MAAFGKIEKADFSGKSAEALDLERIVCVAAIFSLASLPLLVSVALAVWGA